MSDTPTTISVTCDSCQTPNTVEITEDGVFDGCAGCDRRITMMLEDALEYVISNEAQEGMIKAMNAIPASFQRGKKEIHHAIAEGFIEVRYRSYSKASIEWRRTPAGCAIYPLVWRARRPHETNS